MQSTRDITDADVERHAAMLDVCVPQDHFQAQIPVFPQLPCISASDIERASSAIDNADGSALSRL